MRSRKEEYESGVERERKAMIKREAQQILNDEAQGAHLSATPASYDDFAA